MTTEERREKLIYDLDRVDMAKRLWENEEDAEEVMRSFACGFDPYDHLLDRFPIWDWGPDRSFLKVLRSMRDQVRIPKDEDGAAEAFAVAILFHHEYIEFDKSYPLVLGPAKWCADLFPKIVDKWERYSNVPEDKN